MTIYHLQWPTALDCQDVAQGSFIQYLLPYHILHNGLNLVFTSPTPSILMGTATCRGVMFESSYDLF